MSAEGISSQVRRIAILVTSLDASAGRQLLMAMPTELARQVRRAMTQLGHVDPDEQRQILAEFRRQAITANDSSPAPHERSHDNSAAIPPTRERGDFGGDMRHTGQMVGQVDERVTPSGFTPRGVGNQPGLAPTGSGNQPGLAPIGSGNQPGLAPIGSGNQPGLAPTGSGVGAFDVNTLGELLRGERATVVAVVLSQLDPRQGADLLGKLPKPLQREAIISLSRIGQIDPAAMQAIDEHLASRIADYRHRQAGESESTGRMQELLAAAAPDLRGDWQQTLAQAEPLLASRLGIAAPAATKELARTEVQPTAQPFAQPIAQPVASGHTKSASESIGVRQAAVNAIVREPVPTSRAADEAAKAAKMLELLANNVVTTADRLADKTTAEEPDDDRAHILPFPTKATPAAAIRFEQILDLPADEIGQILAAADTDVILYALAGASPAFMKRFMAMLDRADGRALQSRLKQLRAINLKDVDAAQRRLCELAVGRRGRAA